ncbi:MAG TPA: hypothetical protein VH184_16025 [Dongiaceae bacterium]|jgi:hypothetical protein|nr:hypothetical protein [Dongiaceae bacterium]
MLTLAEIGPALYGAWRLAHLDPDGMRYFDRSVTGFWRSFRVAVLAAPLVIVILGADLSQMHIGGSWARVIIAETIAYVISWVAYPLAAFYLVHLIDRQHDYFGFVTALNWGTLLQYAFLLPIHVVANSGLLSVGLADWLVFGGQFAVLAYEWFITRTALRTSGLTAASFVLVDFVIGYLVSFLGAMEAYAS